MTPTPVVPPDSAFRVFRRNLAAIWQELRPACGTVAEQKKQAWAARPGSKSTGERESTGMCPTALSRAPSPQWEGRAAQIGK